MTKTINISQKGGAINVLNDVSKVKNQTKIEPQKTTEGSTNKNIETVKNQPNTLEQKTTQKANSNSNEEKKFSKRILLLTIGAVVILLGIISFYYFEIYKYKPKSQSEVLSFVTNYVPSNSTPTLWKESLPLLDQPTEPKTEESPLNGLLFTKKQMNIMMQRRPVAVMINNHQATRPQSGLTSADIVIETNAESGITRYLAFFWSTAPEKVGSIRSLRQYYLEWLNEYDPILIHDGCAQTNNPLTNACGNTHLYGIKDISTIGAWRLNDGVRFAPHNEYSSVTNAWAYAEKMDWNKFPSTIKKWNFKKDEKQEDRGEKTTINVKFHTILANNGAYNVIWTYDKNTNSYLRKIGGRIDIDQENGQQVSAKNLVIQEVQLRPSGDSDSRIIIKTIDKGNAVILRDGKIVHGKWEKDARTSRTRYFDSNGKEIEFNRGRIWIMVVGKNVGQFDIVEQ